MKSPPGDSKICPQVGAVAPLPSSSLRSLDTTSKFSDAFIIESKTNSKLQSTFSSLWQIITHQQSFVSIQIGLSCFFLFLFSILQWSDLIYFLGQADLFFYFFNQCLQFKLNVHFMYFVFNMFLFSPTCRDNNCTYYNSFSAL